jgi:hypothetical protein
MAHVSIEQDDVYTISERGTKLLFSPEYEKLEHEEKCSLLLLYAAHVNGHKLTAAKFAEVYNENHMAYLKPEEILEWRDMLQEDPYACDLLFSADSLNSMPHAPTN